MKRKICVYVNDEIITRLAATAEQRGATKSGLVGAALDRFLDAAGDQDDRLGVDERLAQMTQQLDQLARELRFVNETVAMHARYHLTITPPLLGMVAQFGALVEGSGKAEIVPQLTPQDGDIVLTHQRVGGFSASQLDVILRSRGIDTVLFAGVATNASVESTVRQASDLGYRTIVVADACSAADPGAHDAA